MFAAKIEREPEPEIGQALYRKIGEFLRDQRMEPNPTNYGFAFRVIAHPNGALAKAVTALTEDGVRLSQRDIESLGQKSGPDKVGAGRGGDAEAQGLVARTQMQVEGFQEVMQSIRAETAGFGRDLEASAAALRQSQTGGPIELETIARITAGMVERVQATEAQLEKATRETSELRSKLEEARNDARHDPLTSLPNRRAIEDEYDSLLAAGEQPVVAICDIDYFKTINDRFGHAVGDRVLKVLANALSEECAGHMVARYGGEEFAILFSRITPNAARAILDAARIAVAAKRYRLRESEESLGEVTFSAGLAKARRGEAWRGVYERADKLLYRAKEEGRNRVL